MCEREPAAPLPAPKPQIREVKLIKRGQIETAWNSFCAASPSAPMVFMALDGFLHEGSERDASEDGGGDGEGSREMTAKQQYRNSKTDSPKIKNWLKWAKIRYLPARGRP